MERRSRSAAAPSSAAGATIVVRRTSTATRLTPDQKLILRQAFDVCPKPDKARVRQVAAAVGMTKQRVLRWFQNRRFRRRDADSGGSTGQRSPSPARSSAAGKASRPRRRGASSTASTAGPAATNRRRCRRGRTEPRRPGAADPSL